MLVLDRDRRIIAANAAMIELLGYPRERMLGHRIDMFLEPDEWQSLDSKWRAFERRGTLDGERSFS